jgi:hypothetical protein
MLDQTYKNREIYAKAGIDITKNITLENAIKIEQLLKSIDIKQKALKPLYHI